MDMIQEVIRTEKASEKRLEKAEKDFARAYTQELDALAKHEQEELRKAQEAHAKALEKLNAALDDDFAKRTAKIREQVERYASLSEKKISSTVNNVLDILNDGN